MRRMTVAMAAPRLHLYLRSKGNQLKRRLAIPNVCKLLYWAHVAAAAAAVAAGSSAGNSTPPRRSARHTSPRVCLTWGRTGVAQAFKMRPSCGFIQSALELVHEPLRLPAAAAVLMTLAQCHCHGFVVDFKFGKHDSESKHTSSRSET